MNEAQHTVHSDEFYNAYKITVRDGAFSLYPDVFFGGRKYFVNDLNTSPAQYLQPMLPYTLKLRLR